MNVLIISYYFYPENHIASFRINSFAKYFQSAGYSVTVVTKGNQDRTAMWNGCEINYIKDPVMPHFYKSSKRKKWTIKRILYSLFYRMVLDPTCVWKIRAYKKVRELWKTKDFDLVLSSYAPLSTHMTAFKLRKKGYKFYWVADMRDEMSLSPFLSSYKIRLIKPYERKILHSADLILSVSEPLIDGFKRFCKHNRFLEIKNGYDYEEVHDVSFQPQFTMSFIGHFYAIINPDNWFKAFSELIRDKEIPSDCRINIIGNLIKITIPDNIVSNVLQIGEVPHSKAIAMSLEADVLVVVHPIGRKGVYTGKLFDYLATNKPILALCDPQDVVGALLNETKSGFVVDEADIAGIKKMILRCYSIWKNKEVLPRDWGKIRQYTRQNQAQILLNYLSKNVALHK